MRQSECLFSRVCTALVALLLATNAAANYSTLWVSDVSVAPRDEKTSFLQFNISWQDSWRNEANHDAAWVFFKVMVEGEPELPTHWSRPSAESKSSKPRTESEKRWQPVRLVANRVLNPDGYEQSKESTPLEFIVPNGPDGFMGVFLRRAEYGRPNDVKANGVTVLWDRTSIKGLTKNTKVQIQAYGIEMVYVPEGPFYLGTGGTEANAFYKFTDGMHNDQPFLVSNAGPIPTGRKNGCLWAAGATPQDGGEIPAAFPNGYGAFYCMKVTIQRRQYADFLNSLTPAEANKHYHPRMVIRSGIGPNYVYRTYAPCRYGRYGAACIGLSWADGAAYAAWAGLRPLTEMELEKAVRGPCEPVVNEGRESYWGVQVLSADCWGMMKRWRQSERAVSAGSIAGRLFAGTHGRGTLDLPADWPQEDAVGACTRMNWWGFDNRENNAGRALMSDPPTYNPGHEGAVQLDRTRVSDRLFANLTDPERRPDHRWRGGRTAPAEAAEPQAVAAMGKP